MRSPARLAALAVLAVAPLAASWPEVFKSVGLDPARITVLEGSSPTAAALGIRPGRESVQVQSITDLFQTKLQIIWERAETIPVYDLPPDARVFTKERWTGAPLVAGLQRDGKAYLWTAVPPGERGYERFPFLIQALGALGAEPRTEGRHLWVFFDSSYRLRADPDYLARRWRAGGVAALHVAAWHYWEPDTQRDQWLKALLAACRRNAILVYAWVEFPHVSEKFWDDHPEWREKTATLQDAHLDWRKLMNLADPACAKAVAVGLTALTARFDWDGINLGELYFESLEGPVNPARFTPFNDTVLGEFCAASPEQCRGGRRAVDVASRAFLDYRAELTRRLQAEWLRRLAGLRKSKPHLDLVLTHIDDRFDLSMRDKLGADAARAIPLAEDLGVTFLVEDPATVWHLGPSRYTEIAKRYALLARKTESLAIDLNIVERYQDVYPTKQQTGVELFQLINHAAEAFPRVALYFENSVSDVDWPWVAAAAAASTTLRQNGDGLDVDAPQPSVVRWSGCAKVNGKPWAARDGDRLLLPVGASHVETCEAPLPTLVLKDFNGRLLDVTEQEGRLRIDYESRARAIAIIGGTQSCVVTLPPGRRSEVVGCVR